MSLDLLLMGALHVETVRGAARLAAVALVAGVWQGMLLCAAIGLILKCIPRSTATLRFAIWTAVFCVAVAMPFLNRHGGAFIGQPSGRAHLTLDLRWSYLLAAAWVVAGMYRLGDLVMQGFGLRALWKSAVPVADGALTGLDAALVVAGRRVEICTSGEVDRPSVIGFFAPRILIPALLFERLTVIELNHIVLHEMEHLRRRDDWVNLLQKIGLVLLPLSPALFWIDRRLSTERELACDDGVLARTKMPRAYAASLASIAERRLDLRLHRPFGALALAATGLRPRQSELGERIESILERRPPVNRAFAGVVAAMLLAGIVGLGAGLACAPQWISFEPDEIARQAQLRPTPTFANPPALPMAAEGRGVRAPGYQNVSFHPLEKARIAKASSRRCKPLKAETFRRFAEDRTSPAVVQRQVVVLTSWEDMPISRVVVATPDGRFFLAPYAAVPTQAGWLVVQL